MVRKAKGSCKHGSLTFSLPPFDHPQCTLAVDFMSTTKPPKKPLHLAVTTAEATNNGVNCLEVIICFSHI